MVLKLLSSSKQFLHNHWQSTCLLKYKTFLLIEEINVKFNCKLYTETCFFFQLFVGLCLIRFITPSFHKLCFILILPYMLQDFSINALSKSPLTSQHSLNVCNIGTKVEICCPTNNCNKKGIKTLIKKLERLWKYFTNFTLLPHKKHKKCCTLHTIYFKIPQLRYLNY